MFIVFDSRVIIGMRVVKMWIKSYDVFESVNYLYVVEVNEDEVKYYWKLMFFYNEFLININLCMDVFFMKLYLGIKLEIFDCLKDLYKGIIIESFGNGGLFFEGRNLFLKI